MAPCRSRHTPTVPITSFDTTLAAARAGAEWAWAVIYRDLAPALLGFLRARGAAEPEDLLGEVFLQIARDLPGFEGSERQLRAWAFTLANHRLVDDRRARGRRPVEPAPTAMLERRGPIGDVEAEATERLEAERVRGILAALPERQQSVLVLRIIGGLTVEEVAEVLGKRPGAVKALQRRGLAAVRRRLEREGVPL